MYYDGENGEWKDGDMSPEQSKKFMDNLKRHAVKRPLDVTVRKGKHYIAVPGQNVRVKSGGWASGMLGEVWIVVESGGKGFAGGSSLIEVKSGGYGRAQDHAKMYLHAGGRGEAFCRAKVVMEPGAKLLDHTENVMIEEVAKIC